jgi:hypothetical protein
MFSLLANLKTFVTHYKGKYQVVAKMALFPRRGMRRKMVPF